MNFRKWMPIALAAGLAWGAAGTGIAAPVLVFAAAAGESVPSLEDGGENAVLSALIRHVTDEFGLSEEDAGYLDGRSFFEVSLGAVPQDGSRLFAAIFYQGDGIRVSLLTAGPDGSEIRTLDTVRESEEEGALVINTAKLDVSAAGNRLTIWSQAPFRALQSTAVLEWNGVQLRIVSHEYSDPSIEFFEKKQALLDKKDLAGLMKLQSAEGGTVMYPAFYAEFFSLAAPSLQLAYAKSLETYRKKDAKTAAAYLRYGLDQYADAYGLWEWETGKLTAADLKGDPDGFNPEGRLPAATVIAMLNDYGFFLSESKKYKEAKLILLNVIKLSPSRAVAYLNAADTEWALGEKGNAKAHYKQYLKLLGKNASKAPKRVHDRIKAK